MRRVAGWLAVGLMLALPFAAAGETGDAWPDHPVVLTVTGRISPDHPEGIARFDMAALRALPQHTIRTASPWTDGPASFTGPRLCDLLDAVGARGTTIVARALNDYAADIPITDCRQYTVLLALARDGQPLSRRGKGPIWIVYPQDDHPDLVTPVVYQRWVWQLRHLEIR